ncbi:MAG TPA: hypothetical protein VFW11_22445 [Cyclobacteriaceae bacterium]|nr:hypothetical protein [Cyclobacteriaceae bacterium]
MKKISKKEIRHKVEDAMNLALQQLEASPTSKKTKKLVEKASKKISSQLKQDLKKLSKKAEKAIKASDKQPKSKKKADVNGKQVEPVFN